MSPNVVQMILSWDSGVLLQGYVDARGVLHILSEIECDRVTLSEIE